MNISLSPFALENLASRDGFGRPVPRQPAHSPYSGWMWYLLTGFLPISAAAAIYLFKPLFTLSGQSRVYRVSQLRTNGIHCRESAGTGPVKLKVVPVTGAVFAGHRGRIYVRLSFPTPTVIGMKWLWHVESTGGTIQYSERWMRNPV